MMQIDYGILYFIQGLHTDFLDRIMVFLTSLGQGTTVWILVCLGMLFFKQTRKCGVLMIISMFICDWLTEDVLKQIFHRYRPFVGVLDVTISIPRPRGYSFPSGHASHSFVAATMIYLHFKGPGRKALILAALIAFSRVYLFVHFPTDIVAGALLGAILAVMIFYAIKLLDLGTGKLRDKLLEKIKIKSA